jgi:hypothetical protein
MKVKLGQAVKMFFGNSSLEMVYFEAIANALDANATEIIIDISAKAYNQPQTITITFSDNGIGFTDERFQKFSNLFDVEESTHKGLGRLVYLCYFDRIKITSQFDETFRREFDFTESFKEEEAKKYKVANAPSGTTISMTNYTLTKLKSYNFIQPKYLKERILSEFYSIFYKLKETKVPFKLSITATVDGATTSTQLSASDIPAMEMVPLESTISLIDKFYLYYSIQEIDPSETSFIAAVSVDNRTVQVEIIAAENIPIGYKMVFLLFSDWFTGKVDAARQNLAIPDHEMQTVQTIFRTKVAAIIEEKIPKIKERNKEAKNNLINKYPHLAGYFNSEQIGFTSRTEVLKKAQDQFFKAQREVLDASSLSEEQYQKSLDISARALTEYILFRQITIEKLKNSAESTEAEIHKLFAPMRTHLSKDNMIDDLYLNNAWLLDDKYMTYEAILSDKEMGDLVKYITEDESLERDDDRPDIAIVFSANPTKIDSFDVVIVELKKRGISLEDSLKTIHQLEKRARKLMKYYKNKIQRIWYYGIIEFNTEIELALTGEYKEIYSSGKMYYRETKVAIQKNPEIILPIGVFIWDIDAVVNDAAARNSAFLNLIKSKFIE